MGCPCGLLSAVRREVEVMPQGTGCLGRAGPLAPEQDQGGLSVLTAVGRCHLLALKGTDTTFDNPDQ